ncbi:TIGR04086 family membrane protein [Lutispora sp.]|uniref:TIGR04086 family membrane protein n=1 Tax=Lutispora sp. TaxID=2828727 RepID=UPI000EEE1E9A|nr:TIGR04086 family membrane protein [Lutispora sp.]MEA4963516.1 TIGR04086 family membrane protein [Lutispora sp.]HCJ56509.1 TIGR04086 family membrane protein [Clostridiaceae bacterium]
MQRFKKKAIKSYDKESENKILILVKSIFLALIISLVCIIIYAVVLSITPVSDNTMSIITQVITMISIVAAAMYCSKKIKSKGWLYGIIIGIIFVLIIIPISMIWGQIPAFDKYFIAKVLMASLVGFIGGIVGVNMS